MTKLGPYDLNSIITGDARELARAIPDNSINCIVTSPPYYGLRDYGEDGQLGQEETPEEYIAKLVDLFRELRRGLRSDGTLWLNLGDSYCNKQLLGIPWRVALVLQADGWWLRSDIIWHKPNPMPESVTDRPTKAHEYIFLLTKAAEYWCDMEAIREENSVSSGGWQSRYRDGKAILSENSITRQSPYLQTGGALVNNGYTYNPSGRNKRSVWSIPTSPYKEAHFAVFPPKLITPCVRAGCPPQACAECGAPWVRVIEKTGSSLPVSEHHGRTGHNGQPPQISGNYWDGPTTRATNVFTPTCQCNALTSPGIVLDPFIGSGTTAQVSIKEGRQWLGFELNPKYVTLARQRVANTQPPLPLVYHEQMSLV